MFHSRRQENHTTLHSALCERTLKLMIFVKLDTQFKAKGRKANATAVTVVLSAQP